MLKELEELLNRYSLERGSNTPDFILAQYLWDCLGSYNKAVKARDDWYDFQPPFSVSDMTVPSTLEDGVK